MAVNYSYINKVKADKARERTNGINRRLGNRFDGNLDPNTSEGLYNIALQNGGRAGEVIAEMAHPKKSILATAGRKLRQLGGTLIDVLETPNEIVAGAINTFKGNGKSLGTNIKEAVLEDISASTALLGEYDSKNKSFMNKAGNFVVRTGVDILLDPLSYVTFGASRGVMGFGAAKKVGVTEKITKRLSLKKGAKVALSEGAGDDVAAFMRLTLQGKADDVIAPIRKRLGAAGIGDDVLEGFIKEEKESLVKLMDAKTVDFDVADEAVKRLLHANPGLTEDLIDKGGVKFFGKTILEGQKIRETAQALPYFTQLDEAVQPLRMAFGKTFDTTVQRVNGKLTKVPQKYLGLSKQLKGYKKDLTNKQLNQMGKILTENGFIDEASQNLAIANTMHGSVPADPKLANVYYGLLGLDVEGRQAVRATGQNLSVLSNRFVKFFKTGEQAQADKLINFGGVLSENVSTTKQKSNVVFQSVTDPNNKILKDEGTLKQFNLQGGPRRWSRRGNSKGAIEESANQLVGEIDKISKAVESGKVDGALFQEEIYAVERQLSETRAGKYDSIFSDPDTGEVFYRRAATLPEQLTTDGFKFDENDADWLKNISKEVSFTESVAGASVKTLNQTANAEFVNDIARLGAPQGQAPKHFVALKANKTITDANNVPVLFDPEIAENLENVLSVMSKPTKEMEPMLQAYDKVLSLWKSSVTSLFPSFHARNGMSNVLLNSLDIGLESMNPKTWGTSMTLMSMNRKMIKISDEIDSIAAKGGDLKDAVSRRESLMTKPIMTDKYGVSYTFGEIRSHLRSTDTAFTDIATAIKRDESNNGAKFIKELSGKKSKIDKVNKANPFSSDFYGYEAGREVGSAIEDHGRLINFLTNLKKTGDVNLASTRTKQFLFDYSNLTDFERDWVRRVIPFYSFTRFNLEAQAKTLLSAPGKTAGQFKAMRTFTDVFSDDDLTKEEKELLPSYMTRGFHYLKKQKDGTLKGIKITDSPVEQPLEAFGKQGIIGSISPLIRMPLEQMTGYDMWQGKPFSEATNAAAYRYYPQVVKDYIGYDDVTWVDNEGKEQTWHVALKPSRLHLLNNLPPTSRVIGAFRNLSNEDTTVQEKARNYLFGFNERDVDIQKLRRYEEKNTRKQYEEVLDTANVIGSFKRNFISKEE